MCLILFNNGCIKIKKIFVGVLPLLNGVNTEIIILFFIFKFVNLPVLINFARTSELEFFAENLIKDRLKLSNLKRRF